MFEQLKQLKKIQELKNSLAKEKITIEKEGTKIVLNGKMEVEEVSLNPDLPKERQEKVLQECFNEGVKKLQLRLAKNFSQMSGFGL